MKWVFVVNGVAGKGKALSIRDNLEKYCDKNHIEYKMHITRCPGEATKIAKSYKREKCVVFAVGGDGTVNEVLNGIVGTKNMLGVIPAGSGNDFYKTLSEIEENFPVFDVGKINNMYFINSVCFGLDADVANNVDLMKLKGVAKSQLYYASIFYTFFNFKYKSLSFKLNKKKYDGEYTIVTICNGKYYGGGFKIAPSAVHDDGLFDIYFVDKLSKSKIPGLIFKLRKGKHEDSELVNKEKSNSIFIKSKKSLVSNVDGEKLLGTSFKITLKKRKLVVYNNKELIKNLL